MIAKLKLLWTEARTKVTTYVGLSIATIAVVAEKAEDLMSQWPILKALLPAGKVIDTVSHWTLAGLGVLAAIMRVRRTVWPPKQA